MFINFYHHHTFHQYLHNHHINFYYYYYYCYYYYYHIADTCNVADYEFFRQGPLCLKYVKNYVHWPEAKFMCESEGARLVKIDTPEKNNIIRECIKNGWYLLVIRLSGLGHIYCVVYL